MSSSRHDAQLLVDDAKRIFGNRLLTIVTYGTSESGDDRTAPEKVTCMVLVRSLTADDLDGCAGRVRHWHMHGLATPLIVPEEEFYRSLDAFPLEYGAIVDHHEVVFGADLLADATVLPTDLRRAVATKVKSHLLHLRQGFVDSENSPARVTDMLHAAAPALAALLERVARLHGAVADRHDESVRAGARLAGLSDSTVSAVLALEHGDALTSPDGARLFHDYLHAVEQLAVFVDTWRH
jgi:hypothetical protein